MSEQYVVMARRWGDSDTHAFPLGIYEDIELAKLDGYIYYCFRGGKYEPEICTPSEKEWEDDLGRLVPEAMTIVYSTSDFSKDLQEGRFKKGV